MNEDRKVLILCPLWDSEKYIGPEIESVIAQTYTNWNLMISNDRANEETIKIVKDLMAKDSRILMMENNSGRHGGHANYRNLIINTDTKNDSYDYFAYLDNDDIWKPNKLEVYVNKANQVKAEKGEDTPVCFTCNMEIIDSDGNLKDPDFASTYKYEIKRPMDAFITHRVFGCNVFFDRKVFYALRQMMKDPDFPPHISFDNFTYQTAAALGADLSFIPQVLMSYRRHETNTTKNAVYKITPKYVLQSLLGIRQVIHNNAVIARDSIEAINYIKRLDLTPEKRQTILEIQEGLEKGWLPAMKMWHKNHINCGDTIRTVENWLSLCLGFERKYMNREKYPEMQP